MNRSVPINVRFVVTIMLEEQINGGREKRNRRGKEMHVYIDAFLTDEGDPDTIELEHATKDAVYHGALELINKHMDKEYIVHYIQVWEYDSEYDEPIYEFTPEQVFEYLNRVPKECNSIW